MIVGPSDNGCGMNGATLKAFARMVRHRYMLHATRLQHAPLLFTHSVDLFARHCIAVDVVW